MTDQSDDDGGSRSGTTLRETLEQRLNILGEPLEPCSTDPMTGFFRDGCCATAATDRGLHTVCAEVTDAFLEFSKAHGNDLSTPRPEYRFPGLKAGDRWCLCAARWLEAHKAGLAPPINARATHQASLLVIPPEALKAAAKDIN